MPNPGLAAGSFFLGGQLQGQQQQQLMMQQLQERLMDQQIKRAQLMSQLQQLNRYNQAYSAQPKEVQQQLDLGMTPDRIQQQKNLAEQVGFASALIAANPNMSAADKANLTKTLTPGNVGAELKYLETKPNRPTALEEKLQLMQTPEGRATLHEMAALGWKPDKPERARLGTFTDPTDGHTYVVNLDTGERMHDLGGLTKGKGPTGTEADIDEYKRLHPGATREEAEAHHKTVMTAAGVAGKGPSPAEKRQLEQIDSAEQLAGQLKAVIPALGHPSSSKLAWEYGKYLAPFGPGGPSDPAFEDYFNKLGQLQTDLVGASTSGNSKAYALIKMLKPHIPSPTDPPDRAMNKVLNFESGRFATIRKAIMEGGIPTTPGAPTVPAIAPPAAPFGSGSAGPPGVSAAPPLAGSTPPDTVDLGGGYSYSPSTKKYYHAE